MSDFDAIAKSLGEDSMLDEATKNQVLRNLTRLKTTKVNILVTGATGCGKSSTINALFGTEKAKVGQGVDPQTMEISKHEYNSIVLFDSPGLGDGKEADIAHSKNIIEKLYEKDSDGEMLIDLVLVILDGSSRDLGTSFELINSVIIPHLGEDKSRLLVAINQADVAMKGRHWDHEKNEPEPELIKFLDDKVESTQRRIKEATGVDISPIYYAAGYKDGGESQKPYNLSKLLLFILRHTKNAKRAAIFQDLNQDNTMWESNDKLEDYAQEIQKTFFESITDGAANGAEIGAALGKKYFGAEGEYVGKVIGAGVGVVAAVVTKIFSWFD